MARPALGALLFLLLASPGVSTDPDGELCPAAPGTAGGAFRCPQLLDDADAKFCCGTCHLPYCCSAREAELEGQRCPRSALLETTTQATTPQSPPATQGPPTTVQPPTDKPLERWAGLLAFAALLIGMALWNIFCYCRRRRWRQPRAIRYGSLFNIHLPIWLNTRSRFLPPPPLDFPPPYADDPPSYGPEEPPESEEAIQPSPPPSPVVIFHRAFSGSSEDDVTIGPLVHRNVPSSSSESPPLEEELTVD